MTLPPRTYETMDDGELFYTTTPAGGAVARTRDPSLHLGSYQDYSWSPTSSSQVTLAKPQFYKRKIKNKIF